MLKIRGPVVSKDLFWCLQFTLQVELHTGLSKTSASVGCGSHVRFVKLMTLHEREVFYYDYSLYDWETAMNTNMGGGLPIIGFYEMKQDVYDTARRLKG